MISYEKGDYAALADYHRRLELGPLDPDPAEIHDEGPIPINCRHLLVAHGICLNCERSI